MQTRWNLPTPCLLLDEERMRRNIERMNARMRRLGVELRPHLKTAKSIPVAQRMLQGWRGGATVSTLAEAEAFAAAGVGDLIYAVGIAPAKLDRVSKLIRGGTSTAVILDEIAQARALAAAGRRLRHPLPALIEIDSDGQRSGVAPGDRRKLLALARTLGDANLRGVLTHAGASYQGGGARALAAFAERERQAAVSAAATLRAAGFACPVVSVGSTPTAHAARSLAGVTEVRAGVYVFMDLVMAGLGVCGLDDIALSVLATVIGHQKDKGWILTDAGWMALARDRGTASQARDQGYGLACSAAGRPWNDLIVSETNQEHGILSLRPGSRDRLPKLGVGTQIRILPNHACATAARFDRYQVLRRGRAPTVWPRFGGW